MRSRPVRLLVALHVVLAACGDSPASPRTPRTLAPIARILDSIRAANDLPALGGAVVTTDSVWALAVVGMRRYSGTLPATPDDKFHLGSNLKAMTSAMIGGMVDAGFLSWDLTLEAALPDLVPVMRAEYRPVTIADLLSHTGGLPRDPGIALGATTARAQREEVAAWALAQPATPRGEYAYSNVGYMVAGLIAERVAAVPFETLIVERLFAPLGITSAGFGAMGTPGMEDQPWQHYFDGGGNRREVAPGPNADNPLAYGPAGRAHMNLRDWARFIRAVLQAHEGDASLWSAQTATMLTTPRVAIGSDGYAMGWRTTQRTWAPGRILTHNGSNTMSYSVAWVAPDAGFGVLVVTNQGGTRAAQATDGAAGRLIGLFLNGR